MNALAEFKDYYKRLDKLIADSTKEDLAECARLLALNVAHYKAKYGELPLEEHQAMLDILAFSSSERGFVNMSGLPLLRSSVKKMSSVSLILFRLPSINSYIVSTLESS